MSFAPQIVGGAKIPVTVEVAANNVTKAISELDRAIKELFPENAPMSLEASQLAQSVSALVLENNSIKALLVTAERIRLRAREASIISQQPEQKNDQPKQENYDFSIENLL